MQELDCHQIIQNAWNTYCAGSPALRLCKKIRLTKVALKKWNRERVGNLPRNIQRLEQELELVQVKLLLSLIAFWKSNCVWLW